jgi:hypothetical protein
MSTLLRPNQTELGSQASQVKLVTNDPTAEEMADWGEDKLFQWIKQKQPRVLNDKNLAKFKKASISGKGFLKYAGDEAFFEQRCGLPAGASSDLADLAKEIKMSKKNKHYLPCYGRNSDS